MDDVRWDPSTFMGRLRYFAAITDPRLVFASRDRLFHAKQVVESEKRTGVRKMRDEESRDLRRLYASAFHPDTGDLQNLAGRMCFNVYGGTILCGAMMIWYKSTPAVVFWQWANQSFNALVNYTNRNAKSEMSERDLLVAYVSAVGGALGVAIGLKRHFAKRASSVLMQRLVPLAAVMVANAINIPLMRQNELRHGLLLTDENDKEMGHSKFAALKAISLVVLSRNVIVAPTMILTPVVMGYLEKFAWVKRNLRVVNIPAQLVLTFVLLGAMIPVGCALFPQRNHVDVETLQRWEPSAHAQLMQRAPGVGRFYFNKGL